MYNHIDSFRAAIQGSGLVPPKVVVPDGKIHRFASSGKAGDDAGWYLLFDGCVAAGAFGDWRTGASARWRADIGRGLTLQEAAALQFKLESLRRERGAATAKQQAEACNKAAKIWSLANGVPKDNGYLLSKGVGVHGIREHCGALVVPMRDRGALHSLQFIYPDGSKRFLKGGRVRGCYHSMGKPSDVLCIAEGYATGASVNEATGYAVAVAFNAGNLVPVAEALRRRFPDKRIVVCADDDIATEGNPGLTKAREGAQAVSGCVAVPDFGAHRPEYATDFNDLHRLQGAARVREIINAALMSSTSAFTMAGGKSGAVITERTP